MTSKSMPWTTNNTGDGPTAGYATDRWQEMLRTLSTLDPTLYYVAPNRLNEYAVSGASSPVAVASGEGFVNGRHVLDDASQNVAVPTPTVSTRIDRIILRSDGTAQTVRVVRLAGTEGAGSPPALTQNSTTYEVSLARVSITTGGVITLTDERGWLGVRGAVDGTTLEWDNSGKKIRVKDAGISAAKLASDAVTTVKILDSNVTAAKLASDAVTTVKILDGNVTNAKLASGIDGAKITTGAPSITGLTNSGSETVGGNSTVTGQITSNKVGAGTTAGALVSSSQPSIALSETDQTTDEKTWDIISTGKVFAIRAVNDANNSATTVLQAARGTGVAVSLVTIGPDVSFSGAVTVVGTTTLAGVTASGNATVTGQITSNKVGSATSAGVLVSSTQPSIALNETDQATDEKTWDIISTGKVFAIRAVNDAGSSATSVFQATRGAGVAISLVVIAADTQIQGQITSTKVGFGTSSGMYVSSTQPSIALNETDQTTDEKLWDIIATAKVFAIRAVADSGGSATTAIQVSRSTGINISTVTIGANLSVTGTITGTPIDGFIATAAKLADGVVTTAKVADDAIDDTKVGNRVPQLYRRQGGDATNWATTGTTTQTPAAVRKQVGSVLVTIGSGTPSVGAAYATATVTFPTAFSATPVALLTPSIGSTAIAGYFIATITAISASAFTISLWPISNTPVGSNTLAIYWEATGSE